MQQQPHTRDSSQATWPLLAALLALLAFGAGCQPASQPTQAALPTNPQLATAKPEHPTLKVGAEVLLERHLPRLKGKRVALLIHNASRVYPTPTSPGTLLLDTLLAAGIEVVRVFTPEHGLATNRPPGDEVPDNADPALVPVVSLYGPRKAPSQTHLADVDLLLADMQDVGVRPYTYISTLLHTLRACAQAKVPAMVLDRPNPNGWYVAGPTLPESLRTFVGALPVPMVHGLTLGEQARMAQGEGWSAPAAELTIIEAEGYRRSMRWDETGRPWQPSSPNLRSLLAVECYPILVWHERTPTSVGRGTPAPFTRLGFPQYQSAHRTWVEDSIDGAPKRFDLYGMPWQASRWVPEAIADQASDPALLGDTCWGLQALARPPHGDSLWLAGLHLLRSAYHEWREAYRDWPRHPPFFQPGFDQLSGDPRLPGWIRAERTPQAILAEWAAGRDAFLRQRRPYLLYPD